VHDLVFRTLAADTVTPVRAYFALRAQSAGRSSFLFESVVPGERWGRFSILGYRAMREAVLNGLGDPLASLAESLAEEPTFAPAPPGATPAMALAAKVARSLVGYLAYDAIHHVFGIEPWPDEQHIARVMRDPAVVVFDNLEQTVTIAAHSKNAVDRCEWEMTHGPEMPLLPAPDPRAQPQWLDVSIEDAGYASRVERAKEHIRAGDAFQIVLARSFTSPARGADAFDVYRAMRVLSPSPYLYFLDFAGSPMSEGVTIVGASPETMVRVRGGKMTLRPIAGTRRRGATAEEDDALVAELLADPKERAEHTMLVDLARNDVGRVCAPGTVAVTASMEVEKYSHVMHIVSEVSGTLRPDATPADAVRAAFPAGTLTGAPKERATQIIRALEPRSRDVYGGAVGWLSPDGDLDLAIAIRTVVARRAELRVTAGAGIVEGSVPAAEAEETRSKARGALAAIRAAQDAVSARAEAAAELERRREAKRAKEEAEAAAKAEAEAKVADDAGAEGGEGGEGPTG
jgi:anthranilate synthase component 1